MGMGRINGPESNKLGSPDWHATQSFNESMRPRNSVIGSGGRGKGGCSQVFGAILIIGAVLLGIEVFSDKSGDGSRSKPTTQASSLQTETPARNLPPTLRVESIIRDINSVSSANLHVERGALYMEGTSHDGFPDEVGFFVSQMDLSQMQYEGDSLGVPCRDQSKCVAYRTFDGNSAASVERSQEAFAGFKIWGVANQVNAGRVLSDLRLLQQLDH